MGKNSSPDFRFANMIREEDLRQRVTFPTFHNADGKCVNTLDLIITNSDLSIENIVSGTPLDKDNTKKTVHHHFSITCDIANLDACSHSKESPPEQNVY